MFDDAPSGAAFGKLAGVLKIEMGFTEAQAANSTVDAFLVATKDVGEQRRLTNLVANPEGGAVKAEDVGSICRRTWAFGEQNQQAVGIAQSQAWASETFRWAAGAPGGDGAIVPVACSAVRDGEADLFGLTCAMTSGRSVCVDPEGEAGPSAAWRGAVEMPSLWGVKEIEAEKPGVEGEISLRQACASCDLIEADRG